MPGDEMTSFDHGDGSNILSSLPQSRSRDGPLVRVERVHPKHTGLMTLPREMRDEIYRHLLCIDRLATVMYDGTNAAKIDLSLLRVNKTLHDEASRTLYEENPWVCITIEASLLKALGGEEVGKKKGFPGSKPVLLASYARTTTVAAATMTLHKLPQTSLVVERIPLLVSLFAIPRLCRVLTGYRKIQEVAVTVRSNTKNAGRVKEAWQVRLLDCCNEARGIGSATILDAEGNRCHLKLATMMMSAFKSFQEFHDRVSMYQERALQNKKRGQLLEACYDYQDCHEFSFWFTISKRINSGLYFDSHVKRQIIQSLHATCVSCAFLYIKLGELDRAISAIDWLSVLPRGNMIHVDETEMWFRCGLRDLAIGAGIGAAYCFLQTLRKEPGHLGADEAVDDIESRLGSSTEVTERIILHNLEHVLRHFRHRTHDSAAISEAEYETLMEQWYVGKKEEESYGYRSMMRSQERGRMLY